MALVKHTKSPIEPSNFFDPPETSIQAETIQNHVVYDASADQILIVTGRHVANTTFVIEAPRIDTFIADRYVIAGAPNDLYLGVL